jgi:hypothetical protein
VLYFLGAVALAACSTDDTSPEAKAVGPDSSIDDAHRAEDDVRDEQTDVSNSEDDGGSGGGAATGLHPRWVLYDGDGDAVEAIVNAPYPAQNQYLMNQPTGTAVEPTTLSPSCVSVRAVGSEVLPVAVPIDRTTGEIDPCVTDYTQSAYYLDSQCSGTPHIVPSVFFIAIVEQEVLWPKGEIIEPSTAYRRVNGSCEEQTYANKLVPLQPVPSWIRDRLPNPPYTVKAEY